MQNIEKAFPKKGEHRVSIVSVLQLVSIQEILGWIQERYPHPEMDGAWLSKASKIGVNQLWEYGGQENRVPQFLPLFFGKMGLLTSGCMWFWMWQFTKKIAGCFLCRWAVQSWKGFRRWIMKVLLFWKAVFSNLSDMLPYWANGLFTESF